MTDTTSLEALADRLEAANRWRRGNGEQHPDPTALGADIDAAVAALRQVSELRARLQKAAHWAEHAMLMRSSQNAELLRILRGEAERPAR